LPGELGSSGWENDVQGQGGVEAASRVTFKDRPRRRDADERTIVTRQRLCLALLALVALAATVAVLVPASANAASLADQLRTSRRELRRAEARLDASQDALRAALLAGQRRGLGVYIREVEVAEHAVDFWRAVVRRLVERKNRQEWASLERSGTWRPLIERAAKKFGVNPDGLYRLMMMESGGKARAVGAGRFYGLYQYSLTTWKGAWNPWRGQNVFDGSAQIEASAYAVKKGMGRSLWGNTFPSAF
jgi:hypothetical protein